MNRRNSTLLIAALLAGLGQSAANAEIMYTTTAFTGTDTDYTSLGNDSLPYTDSNGTTVSTSNEGSDGIYSTTGLVFNMNGSGTDTLTWDLMSSVYQVGFAFFEGFSDPSISLQSVTLGSDSSTSYTDSPSSVGFMGFTDTVNAFNTVSLTFTGASNATAALTDFIFVPNTVPEPASVVNMALGAMAVAGTAGYRRRRRAGARA